jgi:tRNA A-37 threonylcarbamoyl transferase component Bud32
MSTDSERVSRIAAAVADRRPVDWDRETLQNPAIEHELHGLRTVEAVSAAATQRWGNLEIIERLGHGGSADVYRAWDPGLQREVALKLPHLRQELTSEHFLAEARRLARIDHPSVLKVHGAEEHDGRVGMWTDLLEGRDLEQYLEEQGTFSASEAALIGVQLCSALAAVHCAGLIHRDIKASNVMRREGGKIILTDFSSVVEQPRRGRFRDDALTYGTPSYMAPEMLEGQEASSASDLYSLGVLLFRLVSGKYPVEAEGLHDLRERHRRRELASLYDVRPDLPQGFVSVVERALAAAPDERFLTAGDMERALMPLVAAPVQPPTTAEPRKRNRLHALPLVVAFVLLGLAGLLGLRLLQPTAAFTIDASLFRLGEGVEERLVPGGHLELGDRLFLEFASTRPSWLYVLNEDRRGRRYVLFPLELLERENPLPADQTHRLPGRAAGTASGQGQDELFWTVTSTGGEETLLLIASVRRLEALELEIADLPRVGSATALEIDGKRLETTLRGIAGLGPAPSAEPGAATGSLSELSSRLLAADSEELEIWEIRLRNPSDGGD